MKKTLKKTLYAGGLAALILGLPMNSDALTFSNALLCDSSNNCNFSVSGEYTDSFWKFTFDKIAGSGAQDEGGLIEVSNAPNGTTDPSQVANIQDWNLNIGAGSEPNTTSYTTAKTIFGQSIGTNSQDFGAYFDGTQPIGMGSAPLDGTWYVAVTDRNTPGVKFEGYVPAPTTVVPEPVSSTLFVAGAAALGYRRLRKEKKK